MNSTYIQTTKQTFRCELDTDLETFDRQFSYHASSYAHFRELHLKRLFGDGLIGDYAFLLDAPMDKERRKAAIRDIVANGKVGVTVADQPVCGVSIESFRPGKIEVTIDRMIPIGGTLPSETGAAEKMLTGGMVVTLWVLDWIAEHYHVQPEPQFPLGKHAQWERAQIGDAWECTYLEAARNLKRVDRIWEILERYELIEPLDAPTGAPDADQVAAKAYWKEIVRQAKASGNVKQYLSERDIPRSSYYAHKSLFDL